MSISAATRNLKFMRNAKLGTPPSTPSSTNLPSTPGGVKSTPGNNTSATPSNDANSTFTDSPTPSKYLEAEKEVQWVLPRANTKKNMKKTKKAAGTVGVKVSTVQSYMPFMSAGNQDEDSEDEDDQDDMEENRSSAVKAVNGRMNFGMTHGYKKATTPPPDTPASASLRQSHTQSQTPSQPPRRAQQNLDSTATASSSRTNSTPSSSRLRHQLNDRGFAKPSGFDDLPPRPSSGPASSSSSSRRNNNKRKKGEKTGNTNDGEEVESQPPVELNEQDEILMNGARAKKVPKKEKIKKALKAKNVTEPTTFEDAADALAGGNSDDEEEVDRFMDGMLSELRDE